MAVRVITPADVLPVSLDEAKAHLRVSTSDDDARIETLIQAAAGNIGSPDGWLGLSLVEQTLELTLDSFPGNEILLPFGPVQSVESVKYDDDDGVEQTVSSDNYDLDTSSKDGAWLLPVDGVSWPSTYNAVNAVRVRYVAGYPILTGDEASTPAPIKIAALEGVRALYDGLTGDDLAAAERIQKQMLATYRVFR